MNHYSCEPIPDLRTMRVQDRPRERLLSEGAPALSDHELLAVLLGTGWKNAGVGQLSEALLRCFDEAAQVPDSAELLRIKGMGTAQTAKVLAAIEFARRRLRPAESRISSPADILPVVRHYADRGRECFLSITLNGAHEVISVHLVSIGLVNRTIVHPREVYAEAVTERATALIAAHNHPSGNLEPSHEDREITSRLRQAGDILGIPMLDHVIFSRDGYLSMLERGLMAEA